MRNIVAGVALLCSIIALGSCTHQSTMPELPAVSFSKEILPIFIGNCTQPGCHGSDASSEVFPLTTYDEITQAGIIPGNAVGSTIYKSISGRGLVQAMPPNNYLSENDLQTVYIWIQQGAKNN